MNTPVDAKKEMENLIRQLEESGFGEDDTLKWMKEMCGMETENEIPQTKG